MNSPGSGTRSLLLAGTMRQRRSSRWLVDQELIYTAAIDKHFRLAIKPANRKDDRNA